MNTIYLVGGIKSHCSDLLDGFATSLKGLKQIVETHWLKNLGDSLDEIEIAIDFDEKTIVITEGEDGLTYSHRYFIHVVRRAP